VIIFITEWHSSNVSVREFEDRLKGCRFESWRGQKGWYMFTKENKNVKAKQKVETIWKLEIILPKEKQYSTETLRHDFGKVSVKRCSQSCRWIQL